EFGYDAGAMLVCNNGRPLRSNFASADDRDMESPAATIGPKCSIIIPVHNNASLTRNCLENLLATVPADLDCEIIVTDDGSTDNTVDVLNTYSNRTRIVSHT